MRLISVLLLLSGLSMMLRAQVQHRNVVSGKPLVTHVSTAHAAAHVFNGILYVYVSHDSEAYAGRTSGVSYEPRDYHLLRMNETADAARDLGTVFKPASVGKPYGAQDVAEKDGRYYFYFSVTDRLGIPRIGVACGTSPEGYFRAALNPVGSGFSADPMVFRDDDGRQYMYFRSQGRVQLQRWSDSGCHPVVKEPAGNQPGPGPMIAQMKPDMKSFAETPVPVAINDSSGKPLLADDRARRFYEGAHVHRYKERYYLIYSTGNSHRIVYATSRNPYGPFTYRGVLLPPVAGGNTYASVVAYKGRWYVFYHESSLSAGKSLRSVKMLELVHEGVALSLRSSLQ
jgi:hypothetical protein